MTTSSSAPAGLNLTDYLGRAQAVILPSRLSGAARPEPVGPDRKLRVGVDLGTAYLVLAVLDEEGVPMAGEWQFAQVVRDGLVVDFEGAVALLRGMRERVERRVGRRLTRAGSGYPPGVPRADARAKAFAVEAAGMDCDHSIDEPTAANRVLSIRDGAIVDVGGGTTGIAVVRDGEVVHTADEATGGTHFSLVIAGSLGIEFEQAEALKVEAAEQPRLMPLVRPVMEKVASIILRHIRGWDVPSITMVGGTSAFTGMAEVICSCTGIPTEVPASPWAVTPLGMALNCPAF